MFVILTSYSHFSSSFYSFFVSVVKITYRNRTNEFLFPPSTFYNFIFSFRKKGFGGTAGMAFVGTVCSRSHAGGINVVRCSLSTVWDIDIRAVSSTG